jgi:predicted GNAT superfamily acetyltransferase
MPMSRKLDTNAVLNAVAPSPAVTIRELRSQADLLLCVNLQRRIWGEDFAGVVPTSLLMVASRVGGVISGAFDDLGGLLGFIFGLTGVDKGSVVHWSHMLGVAPEAQNHGIGRHLKEHQRSEVAKLGVRTILWTFDPLVARNAHLNLNVFGVRVTDYVENMYGESTSPLHRGIGTDRFVVAWPVDDAGLAARRRDMATAVAVAGSEGILRVEIPVDIAKLQASDPAAARAARTRTRSELQDALARGYAVQGFRIEKHAPYGSYLLARMH